MCVLRASGQNFDVRSFLAASPLPICSAYKKGALRLKWQPDGRRHEESGFAADVSEKDFSDLAGQIEDARAFLSDHEAELRRLRTFPGVDWVELNFAIELRIGTDELAVQSDRFPADLLLAAGTLGVDIVMTTYPPMVPDDSTETADS